MNDAIEITCFSISNKVSVPLSARPLRVVALGSGEWQSAHSGSLVYTQRDKAGRIVPFKLQLEAERWNTNKRKYKLMVHKTVSEVRMGIISVQYLASFIFPSSSICRKSVKIFVFMLSFCTIISNKCFYYSYSYNCH